jgi:RHS repeat-associated protein
MICANSVLDYTDNYTYDLNSNRIGETEDQGNTGSTTDTITSTYNADDELTKAVDANTGTTLYGYDANGSQTSVTHTPNGTTTPDSTTTNEYDLQGQLAGSQVTTSAGTAKTTYYYDDSGNRIEETTTAAGSTTPVVTYYLVDTNNPTGYSQPIEQAATPGTPQITYVWGAQLISETYATGATIPGVGTASSPTTYYLLQDAHGSTRLITDANGNIVARYNYDASGNALGFSAATALTTYLYSSMPFDAASGNYYDHARFYDSGTGEFTQADYGYSGSLANPMSDLPYAFTGGDPINMLDISGHLSLGGLAISVSIMAGLNGILGAALGARNGIWGALGGLVGGIDSTYISIYGSFLPGGPIVGFAAGAAVGAASELGITYGYSYLGTWKARFTICLAGVVGSAIGYVAGAGTVEIAESLGQRILDRAGMYQIVENAFRNTSEIEQAGLRNMVVFAVQHPLDTIGVFNKAVTGALSEAAVDALKVFATNSAVTLTDEVANYLVDEAQKFLRGLNNLAKLSQSETP